MPAARAHSGTPPQPRLLSLDDIPPFMAQRLAPERSSTRSPSPHPPVCHTPTILNFVKNADALEPWLLDRLGIFLRGEDPTADRLELGRPRASGHVTSQQFPIRVHYRSRFHQGRAEQVLAMAELSWERQVDMGFFPAVPDDGRGGSDDLDIYLTSYARSGGSAYTTLTYDDPDPTDFRVTSAAYIAIYEGLDMVDEMPAFVAHELNHALQAAMDTAEHTFIWESTAVAIEDLVFDDVNDYYGFIDSFQARPHYSINETAGAYPYGAVVFTQFVDQIMGAGDGTVLAEIWQRAGQEDSVNEPDYLDVIEDMAAERGIGTLTDLYGTFAGWRYFASDLDDGAHFEEAASWPSDAVVRVTEALTIADLPAEGLAPPADMGLEPTDLGANYFTIETTGHSGMLSFILNGHASTRWGVTAVRWYEGRAGEVLAMSQAEQTSTLTGQVSIAGADQVIFAVINLGAENFDAEQQGEPAPYSLDVSLH